MAKRALSVMDASWLHIESTESPMQVGVMAIFSLPKDAPDDYVGQMVMDFKQQNEFYPPWNKKLRSSKLKSLRHFWVDDNDLDLDYHVRHSALPRPGGERELGILVSRLHSHPLDFNRPLWEMHFIEGLEGDRFALYMKMHHSLIDGVGGSRMMSRIMAHGEKESLTMPAFWAVKPESRKKKVNPVATAANAMGSAVEGAKSSGSSIPKIIKALTQTLRAGSREDAMTAPFAAPKSILNGKISAPRRFATQQYSLSHLKELAAAADCTLNDIVLALCAASLRRYLKESNALPKKPLTAGIPVSIRPADDTGTGNAISFIVASMATDIADPRHRLEAIKAATQDAKEHLQSLPASALTQYTMLLMAPYSLSMLTGMAGHVRPMFNVTVSNVPGPRDYLYLRGARLEAAYPVSLVMHGQALNITCQSYADTLNFGFTGCRDTVPHMQRLAVYMGEALKELESVILANRGRKNVTRRKKAS
ncbi:MAG: wax ester/triacylglycerol synthase family O-acyltransferase [Salinisphaeraceae bacterium]|nr:wax ester/triacylglycerol synthase family O-acyltransferase [Salinisphaeraceae bacterium]